MIVVTENRGNASSLVEEGEQYKVTGVEIDEPNSVSIFLQVPMYVVITAGEVMFSITGLEFAYSQVSNIIALSLVNCSSPLSFFSSILKAPVSMKAMCQAAWLLTVAFGNLVVIIVAESSLFDNRVSGLKTHIST